MNTPEKQVHTQTYSTEDQKHHYLFILGFAIGTLVGVTLAGLMAPQGGSQTREIIYERGLELKGRAEEAVLRAQAIANETLQRVQQAAHERLETMPTSPNTT